MANFEFNPIDDYIQLKFKCPNCGEENITDAISVPSPNFEAENHSDSVMENEAFHTCDCGEEFEINIYNGMYGGDGDISNIDEESALEVIEHCADDDYYVDELINEEMYSFLDSNLRDTAMALDDIETVNERSKPLLYRALYANIIACMESYLANTYIKLVFSSQQMKKKFTQTYEPFQKQKIEIAQIYETINIHETRMKNELRNVIYHDLPKVKGMYMALGVNIGDISELCKAVLVRHDIVHRNGKDKDGNLKTIGKTEIENLTTVVSSFIRNIDQQVNSLIDSISL